jgi:hypothetical protein
MTMFEYLMVLVSIIMGLGITQVLRGLSKIARSESADLTITLWAVTLFYLYVQNWWAFWDLNELSAWNQFYFTLTLLIPCAMFGATELLLPMGATASTDWRAHFFKVRRWFFTMMLTFAAIAILYTRVLLGVPFTHPYRIMQAIVVTLMLVGLFSPNPRLQPWVAGGLLGPLLVGQTLFRLLPGLN